MIGTPRNGTTHRTSRRAYEVRPDEAGSGRRCLSALNREEGSRGGRLRRASRVERDWLGSGQNWDEGDGSGGEQRDAEVLERTCAVIERSVLVRWFTGSV